MGAFYRAVPSMKGFSFFFRYSNHFCPPDGANVNESARVYSISVSPSDNTESVRTKV